MAAAGTTGSLISLRLLGGITSLQMTFRLLALLHTTLCAPIAFVVPADAPAMARAAGLPLRGEPLYALAPPPGCLCTGPCSLEYGFCTVPTPSWNSSVCPWAHRMDATNSYVMCVDPVVARTLANFSAYPASGAPSEWNLPCLGWNGVPDLNTSPCAYPDLTRAYAGALLQGAFPSKVRVALRANVFDSASWAPPPVAFTPADFVATVAAINERGLFPFVEFVAGPFNAVAPSPAEVAWANHTFNVGNFTELAALFDFFGVPHGGTPGNDHISPFIEVFSVPNINSLGYTLRRGNPLGGLVPPSLFMLQPSLAELSTGWNYVAHELGHAFGLLHTFQGLDTKGLLNSTCGECVPTAENGWTTGDAIADTPPTGSYYYNWAVYPKPSAYNATACTIAFDSSLFCTALPGGHGNTYNLMSYDEVTCRSNFTALQRARMRCFLEQDMGASVVKGLGPGLVTLRAAAQGGAVALEWLPPVSEVWCPIDAGCIEKYLVQRRAGTAGAWAGIGTSERPAAGAPPPRQFLDKAPLAAAAQYAVIAVDGAGAEGSRFYIDVGPPASW